MLRGSYLILGVNVFFVLGVVVAYLIAVLAGHLKFLWSFISYAGNYPVESCIFSVVFNGCSGSFLLIVIIRYCQICQIIENSELNVAACKSATRRNLASLVFGLIGSIGLSLIGSFQQRNFHLLHITGVGFCTCGTNIYFVFQTYFSFKLLSQETKTWVKIFRLVIVVFTSIDLAAGVVMMMYHVCNHPEVLTKHSVSVPAKEGDTTLFVEGTTLEWILFLLFHFFIYSFWWDFKRIGLKRNQLIFLE